MSLGHRTFIFEQDGTIRRIGTEKLYACLQREPAGALPEYAGQSIRIANVVVGLINRRPARFVRSVFVVYQLDGAGLVDARFRTEMMQTSMDSAAPGLKTDDILESLRPDLAKLEMKDKYRWQPTPKQEAAMRALIFKS